MKTWRLDHSINQKLDISPALSMSDAPASGGKFLGTELDSSPT